MLVIEIKDKKNALKTQDKIMNDLNKNCELCYGENITLVVFSVNWYMLETEKALEGVENNYKLHIDNVNKYVLIAKDSLLSIGNKLEL